MPFKFVGSSLAENFIDRNSGLDASEIYTYSVRACNEYANCVGEEVEGAQLLSPSKVEGLLVEVNDSNSYYEYLRWNEVPGANKYNVYTEQDFETSTVSESSTRWRFRESNNPMLIKVQACYDDVCGEFSEALRISPEPLRGGENLRYFLSDDYETVSLEWDTINFATSYNVYSRSGDEDQLFRRKVFSGKFVDDLNLHDDQVTYWIYPCDAFDNCSSADNITVRQISEDNVSSLNSPSINIYPKAGYNLINSNSRDYEVYHLYRRTELFGQGEKIATQETGIGQSFNFSDNDFAFEQKYYYFIEACINDVCRRSQDRGPYMQDEYLGETGQISNITASNATFSNVIRVTWETTAPVNGFYLYRDGSRIEILGPDVRSYDDANIIQGKLHSYYLVPFITGSGTTEGRPSQTVFGSTDFGLGTEIVPEIQTPTATSDRYFDRIIVRWARESNSYTYKSTALQRNLAPIHWFQQIHTIINMKPET